MSDSYKCQGCLRLKDEVAILRADQAECNAGNEWQAREIERLRTVIKEFAAAVETHAFSISPPNPYTPVLIQIASSARLSIKPAPTNQPTNQPTKPATLGWVGSDMTELQKRKWMDRVISFIFFLGSAVFVGWWAPCVLAAFGFWNYWDGLTRSSLTPNPVSRIVG